MRYVKFYKDKAQAVGEHLANSLYSDLGLGGVKSMVFAHQGGLAYASEILPDVHTLGSHLTKPLAKKALDGFAADVLTANWDAAGENLDNMLVDAQGNITRIDNGGSFLNRAMGARKPVELLNKVTEWSSLFDPGKNPAYAEVAAEAGVSGPADLAESIKVGVANIIKVRDEAGGWAKYVAERAEGLSAIDRQSIVGMLDARTAFLEARAVELWPVSKPDSNPFSKGNVDKARDLYNKKLKEVTDYLETHGVQSQTNRDNLQDLKDYTGTDSENVNLAYRDPSKISPQDLKRYLAMGESARKVLEDAIAAGHGFNGTVSRGMKREKLSRPLLATLQNMQPGGTFIDPGFLSTSADPKIVDRYAGDKGIILRIHSKTGIPIGGISYNGSTSAFGIADEKEVLFPPGKQFRLVSRHDDSNRLVLEFEEV
jgi:hypothetical protein